MIASLWYLPIYIACDIVIYLACDIPINLAYDISLSNLGYLPIYLT